MFRRRDAASEQAAGSPQSTARKGGTRGSTQGNQEARGTADQTKAEGKGRPTPKRRDAERRSPHVRAPRSRKEAYRQVKERQREERRRARVGMAAGDERYLPARDKGPVRKLARDYVDSRRCVGQYFLPLSVVIIALTAIPIRPVQILTYNFVFPLLLLAVIVDSVRISRGVKRLAAERHPQQSRRGLTFYAVTRGLQMRRLRMPGPATRVGDPI